MARDHPDHWLPEISDARSVRVLRLRPSWRYTLFPTHLSKKGPHDRMLNSILIKKLRTPLSALCLIVMVGVACKLSSLTGAKMNMFEGIIAQDGAAKIKAKV